MHVVERQDAHTSTQRDSILKFHQLLEGSGFGCVYLFIIIKSASKLDILNTLNML